MSEYLHYTGREPLFGFGYPGAPAGELGSPHDEGVKTVAIAERIAAMLRALGPGIYEGGVATLSSGAVAITALHAVVMDSLGAVTITQEATTLAATEFPTGTSYVHVQATEDARTDGTCGYYVSSSATPATGALRVARVTKVAGAITAVDCSVQTSPAISSRIPWAELVAEYGGTETLLEMLTAVLGSAYLEATPPSDVDTRLTALEGAGGGGGGGVEYWGDLDQEAAGVDKSIRQGAAEEAETVADAAVAAHVTALHGSSSGTGTAAVAVAAEQWDVVAVNELRLAAATAHYLATVPETLQDAAVVVDGHCGSEFVDPINSTF
jgi:hypothetical protein